MKRLIVAVLATVLGAMLAGCGGAPSEEMAAESDLAAESDNGAADMPAPPDPSLGQGAPSPEPMNAPPADVAEPVTAAPPRSDRGLPVCPGDPRCKRK